MKAIAYREILAMVADGLGWDPDNLDPFEFAQAKRAISAAIEQVYQYAFWPDLTRTEQRTFHPNYDDTEAVDAGAIRYYPPTDAYYTALRDTTGNEPATKTGDTWETNLAYWSKAQRTLSAADWDSDAEYAPGDVVYDPITYAFYQCHTATVPGDLPEDTDYWGEIDELDPVIPWTRAGLNPIGRVEGVYRQDPRIHRGAELIAWDETNTGIQVRETCENNPWVRYELRPPRFTGTTWSASAAYTPVSEEDFVTADTLDPVRGNFAIQGRAALRALVDHEENELRYLDYLAAAGDGLGGEFIFRGTETTADDGVDYLRPDNVSSGTPGRWVRTSNP